MVDNSTSPFERISGWFFVSGRSRQVTFSLSEAPSDFFCWHIHLSAFDMILHSHSASEAFKQKPAARGTRAPHEPSIVGWFCRRPSLAYVVGTVAPPVCHLARV